MDEAEKLNALQELLTEAYVEYVNQRRRKVGDNKSICINTITGV
jgi:hypothetical protein